MTIPIGRIRSRDTASKESLPATDRNESHSRTELRRFLDEAEPKVEAMIRFRHGVNSDDGEITEATVLGYRELAQRLDLATQYEWLRSHAPRAVKLATSHVGINELRRRTKPNHGLSAEQQELSERLTRVLAVLDEGEAAFSPMKLMDGLVGEQAIAIWEMTMIEVPPEPSKDSPPAAFEEQGVHVSF
jgi:hypothetical protein